MLIVIPINSRSQKLKSDSVFIEMDFINRKGVFKEADGALFAGKEFEISFVLKRIKKRVAQKGAEIKEASDMRAEYRFGKWFWVIDTDPPPKKEVGAVEREAETVPDNLPLNDKELRELFERNRKLARELTEASIQFNQRVEEYFDFPYSDTNDDPIIDTLVYGINGISFDEFIKRMEHYKKDIRVPFPEGCDNSKRRGR